MRALLSAVLVVALSSIPAMADYKQWSTEKEEDPFSGGKRLTVDYMTSSRSGVFVFCDTAEKGLTVRAIPGFATDPVLEGATPEIEFAFDGQRAFGQQGSTGAVGDNLAIAQVALSPENAKIFVDKFVAAKKQIAIKDGISDSPHLLAARGSTKAGEALVECMKLQGQ